MSHVCSREVVDEATGKTVDLMAAGTFRDCHRYEKCVAYQEFVKDYAARRGEKSTAEARPVEGSDLRLEMKLKNNLLWKAIHAKFSNVSQFAAAATAAGFKVDQSKVGELLNFKSSPKTAGRWDGNPTWRPQAVAIADFLLTTPEELFPDALYAAVTIHVAVIETSSKLMLAHGVGKLMALPAPAEEAPAAQAERDEIEGLLKKALSKLSFRERAVVEMRYGISDKEEDKGYVFTLEEIAKIFKITRERVRGIEVNALRKIRDRKSSEQLVRAIEDQPDCETCGDRLAIWVDCAYVKCPGAEDSEKCATGERHKVLCPKCGSLARKEDIERLTDVNRVRVVRF